MRAGFSDPDGGKWRRRLRFVPPVFALLFAMFGPISGHAAEAMGFAAFGLLHLFNAIDLRQRRPRNAEIECGPGYIDVKKAGLANQRIAAKDITGATTARIASGPVLSLQHRNRRTPITLELTDEAEVEKVRHALGIGHGGFGKVTWATEVDSTQRAWFTGSILGTIAGLGLAACMLIGNPAELASVLLGLLGFVSTIMALVGVSSPKALPTVMVTAAGISLRTPQGWFSLPFDALQSINETPDRLVFVVPPPFNWVTIAKSRAVQGGLAEHDREILKAQLTAASQRARGMGPQKTDVTGRVDVLRRQGESPRDWLVRLDMAGQMLAAGSGYRGNTLDTEDLWAVLEDPEAEPELRAAAARVLRHSSAAETRVRIDAAVAAVRDEPTNRRLRIAVQDDLDGASAELAHLDAEDHARMQARMQFGR